MWSCSYRFPFKYIFVMYTHIYGLGHIALVYLPLYPFYHFQPIVLGGSRYYKWVFTITPFSCLSDHAMPKYGNGGVELKNHGYSYTLCAEDNDFIPRSSLLTHWSPGRGSNFKRDIFEHMLQINFLNTFVNVPSGDCHRTHVICHFVYFL